MTMTENKPDWIRTSEPGSFAESTIKDRKPKILQQVLMDNEYSPEIQNNIHDFVAEIKSGPVKPLSFLHSDIELWNRKLIKLAPSGWLDLPWFFAEVYFYRRLLEITGYYDENSPNYYKDPFGKQKMTQMTQDLDAMRGLSWLVEQDDAEAHFSALLHSALWGNRADLSNINVKLGHAREEMEGADHLIEVIDDTSTIFSALQPKKIDLIYFLDNVGRELFSDLVLIEYLVRNGWVKNTTVIAKPAPFFVSDAMVDDVAASIDMMVHDSDSALRQIGCRLVDFVNDGKISMTALPYLNGYHMYEKMPAAFFSELENHHLAIMKGDANYRRMVGDRHWPAITETARLLEFFPIPVILLRTIKAELIVGLRPGEAERISAHSPDWLISGNYGLIQYIPKKRR